MAINNLQRQLGIKFPEKGEQKAASELSRPIQLDKILKNYYITKHQAYRHITECYSKHRKYMQNSYIQLLLSNYKNKIIQNYSYIKNKTSMS